MNEQQPRNKPALPALVIRIRLTSLSKGGCLRGKRLDAKRPLPRGVFGDHADGQGGLGLVALLDERVRPDELGELDGQQLILATRREEKNLK